MSAVRTKDLIKLLQEADPTGEQEIVVMTNDGYAYNLSPSAELVNCSEGQVDEDNENVNCLMLDAAN
jgi:hypothetical protein